MCFGASPQARLSFFVEICLSSGSSVNPSDTDWSSRESGNTFITSLWTPFVWGPSGQTFAEEISSRLLIFNTSLHLHQIAPRPERSETDVLPKPSHSLPPISSSSRPSPAPLFHALIVSIWWLKHRGGHRHEQLHFYFILLLTQTHPPVSHFLQDAEVNKQTRTTVQMPRQKSLKKLSDINHSEQCGHYFLCSASLIPTAHAS